MFCKINISYLLKRTSIENRRLQKMYELVESLFSKVTGKLKAVQTLTHGEYLKQVCFHKNNDQKITKSANVFLRATKIHYDAH